MSATERSRILVVDGDEQVLAHARRLLQADYDVDVCASWEHGLELLGQHEFIAVLASDTLPWLGGVAFLQRAYALQPHTCRILMGAAPKNDQVITAINNARVHHYLARPWKGAAVKDIIAHEVGLAKHQRQLTREHGHYRALLVDERAALPTRTLSLELAAAALRTNGFLGVLWLDTSKLWAEQANLSPADFAVLEEQALAVMRACRGKVLRQEDILAIDEVGAATFLVYLTAPRDDRIAGVADARACATRLHHFASAQLAQVLQPRRGESWLSVGTGFALYNPHSSPLFQIRQATAQARNAAHAGLHHEDGDDHVVELERIIRDRRVRSLFQPILTLRSQQILGYEALSRGPAGSEYESPEFLMNLADDAGLTFELDRLFRSMALTNAVELPKDCKIFVNTLATTAHDPDLNAARLSRFLAQLDIEPSRVVLEFSERCNIANHSLLVETLESYRNLGVQLAVDDVGAGYSGLERIVALHPNYLKIDRSLIQDAHRLPVKRSVLTALVNLGNSIGAEIIAEGIESTTDIDCLINLGVHHGQGYFLGRPAHAAPRGWASLAAMPTTLM